MNNDTHTVLTNISNKLKEHEETYAKDGYDALAAEMKEMRYQLYNLVRQNSTNDPLVNTKEDRPFIGKGLDNEMYLVFHGSWDAGAFLNNLGINEYTVPLHSFGGFENAILINTELKKDKPEYQIPEILATKLDGYFRALSTWMLENDYDMSLPDGPLDDIDPLDLAEEVRQSMK